MIEKNIPKISIIIPVYNVEKYISQCLESVLSQTMKDIEIIVINDGSTDESGMICEQYEKKDKRIIVLNIAHSGLSCARNAGIAVATSPYIMFVDSDDWVESDFCSIPYRVAQKYKSDIVLFEFYQVWNNKKKNRIKTIVHTGKLAVQEALLYNLYYSTSIWLGLYRRELFDGIRFPAGKIYEDVCITHRLIYRAREIYFVDKYLYNYRVCRNGSITTEKKTRDHPDRKEMLIRRMNDFYKWGYVDYSRKCAFSLIIRYGWKDKMQEPYVKLVKELNGRIPKCFSWKHKVLLVIYWMSPFLFDIICLLNRKRI